MPATLAAVRRARSNPAVWSRDRSPAPQARTKAPRHRRVRSSLSGVPAAKIWISGWPLPGVSSAKRNHGADIGLIGGNVIAARNDGVGAAGIERGRGNAKPAVADGERDLRRGDQQRARRQYGIDQLPQPRVVRGLAGIAGVDRHFERARIEPAISQRIPASRCRCPTARPTAPRRCGPARPASSAATRGRLGIARLR